MTLRAEVEAALGFVAAPLNWKRRYFKVWARYISIWFFCVFITGFTAGLFYSALKLL
jgi:hypothetical protein